MVTYQLRLLRNIRPLTESYKLNHLHQKATQHVLPHILQAQDRISIQTKSVQTPAPYTNSKRLIKMHIASFLATLLTTLPLTTSLPTKRADPIYHGIGLWFITSIPSQRCTQSPSPAEINMLAVLPAGVTASELAFDTVSVEVDYRKVECRAFKDADGVVPLGAPFNYKASVVFSTTEVVGVGSYLCYVVTDEEAGKF